MNATIRHLTALGFTSVLAMPAAQAGVVTANNPGGDAYTYAGGSPGGGEAVGSGGWYYNNVRSAALVGIDGDYPRSGNGSVSFNSPNGNGKADIEYLPGAVKVGDLYASTGSLGLFSALQSMSYDWYRDSASTAAGHLHPSLRVLLDRDGNIGTVGDRGGLVFERVYNGGGYPEDQWVSDSIGASTNLWRFGLGMGTGNGDIDGGYAYDSNLAEWQAFMPNALIIGFSSGVGSGWGPFAGAVDNIAWTIGGVSTTTNFELQSADVPEPASLGLLAIGLAGLAARRRKPG